MTRPPLLLPPLLPLRLPPLLRLRVEQHRKAIRRESHRRRMSNLMIRGNRLENQTRPVLRREIRSTKPYIQITQLQWMILSTATNLRRRLRQQRRRTSLLFRQSVSSNRPPSPLSLNLNAKTVKRRLCHRPKELRRVLKFSQRLYRNRFQYLLRRRFPRPRLLPPTPPVVARRNSHSSSF